MDQNNEKKQEEQIPKNSRKLLDTRLAIILVALLILTSLASIAYLVGLLRSETNRNKSLQQQLTNSRHKNSEIEAKLESLQKKLTELEKVKETTETNNKTE